MLMCSYCCARNQRDVESGRFGSECVVRPTGHVVIKKSNTSFKAKQRQMTDV